MSLILSGTDGLSDVDGTAATPAIRGTDANTGIFFPAADTIAFAEGGAESMRIDSSGNLGIGTTSPIRPLQVGSYGSGNGEIALGASTTGYNSILFGDSATDFYQGYVQYQHNGDFMAFATAATERARIDSSGNLGIGATSPAARLEVSKSENGETGAIIRNATNGSNAGALLKFIAGTDFGQIVRFPASHGAKANQLYITNVGATSPITFATQDTERARIDSSGNLLVNTTTTGAYFDGKITSYSPDTYAPYCGKQGSSAASVNVAWNAGTTGDNAFELFLTETSPTIRGSITYNRAGGLTAFNTTSDYRAKDINGPVTGSGALIDSIPVYMGTMKGATQERPMFIAHETPAYAHTGEKDAVDKDGNPKYQQMDASALIPVMWAEIQSLRQRLSAANL